MLFFWVAYQFVFTCVGQYANQKCSYVFVYLVLLSLFPGTSYSQITGTSPAEIERDGSNSNTNIQERNVLKSDLKILKNDLRELLAEKLKNEEISLSDYHRFLNITSENSSLFGIYQNKSMYSKSCPLVDPVLRGKYCR